MPFQQDTVFAANISRAYGTYHSTFHSQTGQVWAHLFAQNDQLVAHVSIRKGMKFDEVTDDYFDELRRFAADHGFAGRLRIIYSE